MTLLDRINAATGPDRDLDCAIALAMGWFFTVEAGQYAHSPLDYCYLDSEGGVVHPGHGGAQLVPRYTESLDAAVRLIGKALPGWEVRTEPRFWYEPAPHVTWRCILIRPNWDKWNPVNLDWFDNEEAEHADRILSILAAAVIVHGKAGAA